MRRFIAAFLLSATLHALIPALLPRMEEKTARADVLHATLREIKREPQAVAEAQTALEAPPVAESPVAPAQEEKPTEIPPVEKTSLTAPPAQPVAPTKKIETTKPVPAPRKPPKAEPTPVRNESTPTKAKPAAPPVAPDDSQKQTMDLSSGTAVSKTVEAVATAPEQSGETVQRTAPSVVDVAELTVRKKVSPEYPMISRKRRDQGVVTLLAQVSSGRVVSAVVETSSGHDALDASALKAVREWQFDTSGFPGPVTVRIPFRFSLK